VNGLVWEPTDSWGGKGRGLRGSWAAGFRVADYIYIIIVTFFGRRNILPTRVFARQRCIVHNIMLIPISRKSEDNISIVIRVIPNPLSNRLILMATAVENKNVYVPT